MFVGWTSLPHFNSAQISSFNLTVHHFPTFSTAQNNTELQFDRRDLQRQARRPNTLSASTLFPLDSSTAFSFDVWPAIDSIATIKACINGWKIWSGAASYLRTGLWRLMALLLLLYFSEFCWHTDCIMTLPQCAPSRFPLLHSPLETQLEELVVHCNPFFPSTSSWVGLVAV